MTGMKPLVPSSATVAAEQLYTQNLQTPVVYGKASQKSNSQTRGQKIG